MRGLEQPTNLHDKMLDMARQPVPFLDVDHETYLGGIDFHRLQLGDFVLRLLIDTAEFRSRAMSYRDFNVAAGAWCVDYPRYGRMLGFNIKVDDTDAVNIHAEDLVTAKALDANYKQIAVLAVIGPLQEDHASGLETATLHPCGRCRRRLDESPLVHEDTLVVTARPDFKVVQFASLAAITRQHETGEDEGMTTFTYDDTPAVFQPLPSVVGEHAVYHEVDSGDYDSTIGSFLLDRYVSNQNSE